MQPSTKLDPAFSGSESTTADGSAAVSCPGQARVCEPHHEARAGAFGIVVAHQIGHQQSRFEVGQIGVVSRDNRCGLGDSGLRQARHRQARFAHHRHAPAVQLTPRGGFSSVIDDDDRHPRIVQLLGDAQAQVRQPADDDVPGTGARVERRRRTGVRRLGGRRRVDVGHEPEVCPTRVTGMWS